MYFFLFQSKDRYKNAIGICLFVANTNTKGTTLDKNIFTTIASNPI